MTEPLAIVRDYDGLIAALRLRKAELGLSDAALEQISGMTSGHVSKILPAPDQGSTARPDQRKGPARRIAAAKAEAWKARWQKA